MKELKSFLGLANYLRSHIKRFASIVQPLYDLVKGYEKKKRNIKILWNTQCIEAFENIKIAINECQKMYFIEKARDIILETDASDFRIGAYLYQKIDNVFRPVKFSSKTLSKQQCRWSTTGKLLLPQKCP
jgi:hypothetical protein